MTRIVACSFFIGVLLLPSFAFSQTAVELFEIHYQNADELKGAVQAVLSGEGSVTVAASANALIVRDYPKNINMARKILARLDRKPKNIHITVRFIEEQSLKKTGLKIDWRISGPGWLIGTVPSPGRAPGMSIAASLSRLNVRQKQYLNILENRPGTIFVGQSVPFTDYFSHYGAKRGYRSKNTTFKEAGTSFSVIAKTLPDKKIRLTLKPEISYYDSEKRRFSVKNASTEVILDDPGTAIIGSHKGNKDSFGANFLRGVESGRDKTKFVMILIVRSE